MARRRGYWLATACGIIGSGGLFAQTPPGVVVSANPPATPITTVTTLEPGPNVVVTPPFTRAVMLAAPVSHLPAQGSYLLNPYFGYYPTQWRPFPGSPNCEPTGPIVLAPREMVIPPTLTPPTLIPSTPSTVPPIPMMPDPIGPKSNTPDMKTPELKTPDVIPPKPIMVEPPASKKAEPVIPPKPLLLDIPKPKPSAVEPASTGPLLMPPLEVSDPRPLPGEGFAETRTVPTPKPLVRPVEHRTGPEIPLLPGSPLLPKPVVQPPKKLATLGLPKTDEKIDAPLPVIRSGDRVDDDTQRPQWPVIRNGTTPK